MAPRQYRVRITDEEEEGLITAEFRGEVIRQWVYEDDAQRREKMGRAQEFAEGFFVAQGMAIPKITANPEFGTGRMREELITLRDRLKSGSRSDGDLLAAAVNRLQELSTAAQRLVGQDAGEHPQPEEAPASAPGL